MTEIAIGDVDDVENMYLTFDVQDEEYAVNIAYVVEIVGMQKISAVPDVPEYIRGVVNLRGKVIPLMDMRLRFGLPPQEYTDRTTIIVLELEGVPTGLVVDRVTDVVTIPPDDIVPPRYQGDEAMSVVKGLGKRADRVSIVLNLPRLLSAPGTLASVANITPLVEPRTDERNALVSPATPQDRAFKESRL